MRSKVNGSKNGPSLSASPNPFIVELSSESEKDDVLRNANNLLKVEKFKKVFIRKDRTPDEQIAFVKLTREQKDANDDLA